MNALGHFIHPLKRAYMVFGRTVVRLLQKRKTSYCTTHKSASSNLFSQQFYLRFEMHIQRDVIYISAPIGICFTIIFVHAMKNASIPEVSGCYESKQLESENGDLYQKANYNFDKQCSNWESYQYLLLTVLGGGSVEFDFADVDKSKPNFERTGKRILIATYSFLFETVLFKGFVIGKIVADFKENWKKSERELIALRVRTIVMLDDSICACPSSGQVIDTIKAFRMADLMVTLKETFLNLHTPRPN